MILNLAPAGSVTPRMNVLGVVDPRGFPTDGYVQRENRVITETDTLLSEATDLASYAQHLMGEAGRNNADANRMRSEMRRLFQIVEELHSDVHESEAEAERRRREADQAMERACDLMARRRSLLESQHEPQQHLAQDRVVSRKRPVIGEMCPTCQYTTDEVSLQYLPSGCLCQSFCNLCVLGRKEENQEGLLDKLKKAALLKALDIMDGEENEFDNNKI
uniref:RING-type domain-containing protein n=1 Tax=Meloidogyne hapla TaxID=6305 RepID=A0A1I8B751_MELHA